jgi:hypothetical protein
MSLSNWQPDIVGISFAKRKLAIGPEVTIPSDSSPQALTEAYDMKIKCSKDMSTQDGMYVFSPGWLAATWRARNGLTL